MSMFWTAGPWPQCFDELGRWTWPIEMRNEDIGRRKDVLSLGDWAELLHIEESVPDIHLQNLALHLDGADQNPDLVLRKRLGIGRRQGFQFLGHGGVLIGGHLKLKPRPLPCVVKCTLLAERFQAVDRVG